MPNWTGIRVLYKDIKKNQLTVDYKCARGEFKIMVVSFWWSKLIVLFLNDRFRKKFTSVGLWWTEQKRCLVKSNILNNGRNFRFTIAQKPVLSDAYWTIGLFRLTMMKCKYWQEGKCSFSHQWHVFRVQRRVQETYSKLANNKQTNTGNRKSFCIKRYTMRIKKGGKEEWNLTSRQHGKVCFEYTISHPEMRGEKKKESVQHFVTKR